MTKTMFAALLAVGLSAAPLPTLTLNASAQTPVATDSTPKAPSADVTAMRERQKKCGAEWKAAKAAGKIEKGQTWPKYWSACNKRLKTAG